MKNSKVKNLLASTAITTLLSTALFGNAIAQNEIVTQDDLLAQINDVIPSFAGVFLEGDTAVVLSTDPTLPFLEEDVIEAMNDIVGQVPFAGVDGVEIREASHTFKKLNAWFENTNGVFGIDGVTFRDIDERENKLAFGLAPEADQSAVEALLTGKGIPLSAVEFETSEYDESILDLRDRFRPTQAGIEIKRDAGGGCTLGFNARVDNRRFFITNSHCTNTNGGVEGTKFDQPSPFNPQNPPFGPVISPGVAVPTAIGIEVADPIYTTASQRCDPGRVCRFSDSAAGEYFSGVPSSTGRIARPKVWGSIEVANRSPFYEIENISIVSLPGTLLAKVGRTTGRTGGMVSRTCVDVLTGGGLEHLCQNIVTPFAGYGGGIAPLALGGDSGSPVFRVNSNDNGVRQVSLFGIVRGQQGNNFVYSPVASIFGELAPVIGNFQIQ